MDNCIDCEQCSRCQLLLGGQLVDRAVKKGTGKEGVSSEAGYNAKKLWSNAR